MKFSTLKQDALLCIKNHLGTVLGTAILFTIINLMFSLSMSMFADNEGNLQGAGILIYFIMMIVMLPLSTGMINTIVKISNNKKVPITDFITFSVKNFFKIWGVFIRIMIEAIIISLVAALITFVILFILSALSILNSTLSQASAILFYLIFIVAVVIRILPYYFGFFILSESPDKKVKEIIKESKEKFKGHLIDFILLFVSFLGWAILFKLIEAVAYAFAPYVVYYLISFLPTILLTPYVTATQYAFYEDAVSNSNPKQETKKEEI